MRQIKNIYIFISLIISSAYTYAQNVDYNKYESSKNEDLSYKVYLDNQNSNSINPSYDSDDYKNRFITEENLDRRKEKYLFADVGKGNYAYRKKTADWGTFSSLNLSEHKGNEEKKTGEWNYYFNGKLKEKSNYCMGKRQGPTYLYNDNGKISDTLYYDFDYVDGMLNLDKMSNYVEFLRGEKRYSQCTSHFENGEWIEEIGKSVQFVGKKNGNNKRHGKWKVYRSGKLKQIINYKNGVRHGKSIIFHQGNHSDSGLIEFIINYDNGFISGECTEYSPTGKVTAISNFKQNAIIGKKIVIDGSGDGRPYFENGLDDIFIKDPVLLLRIKNFKNPNTSESLKSFNAEKFKSFKLYSKTSKEVEKNIPTSKNSKELRNIATTNKPPESEDDTVYNSMGLDKRPSFIEGNGDLDAYVNESFNNKNLSGKIFVSFVVEKDGNLSGLKVVRDLGEGSGDEVIRILNLCKNCWSPAEMQGKKVRCSYSLPVTINN